MFIIPNIYVLVRQGSAISAELASAHVYDHLVLPSDPTFAGGHEGSQVEAGRETGLLYAQPIDTQVEKEN